MLSLESAGDASIANRISPICLVVVNAVVAPQSMRIDSSRLLCLLRAGGKYRHGNNTGV